MNRILLVAAVVVAVVAGPAFAGAPAPPPSTFQKFAWSEVLVTGKVTAIEKDTVDATPPYAGAKDQVAYKVAVVKIDGGLVGASNLTHIKVGFIPPDPNAPPLRGSGGVIRQREPVPVLKEGQEMLLFLAKHPTADFYVMGYRNMPVDISTDAGKKELETVKKFAAALADPMKGLKSDKAEVRGETAMIVVMKYRAYPTFATKIEEVAIPVEESKLLLKGLAEADWDGRAGGPTHPLYAYYQLGLTEKDGWKEPVAKPGVNFNTLMKEAFAEWLAGPGKDYQIKKIVPKK